MVFALCFGDMGKCQPLFWMFVMSDKRPALSPGTGAGDTGSCGAGNLALSCCFPHMALTHTLLWLAGLCGPLRSSVASLGAQVTASKCCTLVLHWESRFTSESLYLLIYEMGIIPCSQVSWELKEGIVCKVFTWHVIDFVVIMISMNILCALTVRCALLDDLVSVSPE